MTIKEKTTYYNEDSEFTFKPIEDTLKTTETKNGYEVKYLRFDELPESPRDWENLGTMLCLHKQYNLG